MNPPGSRPGTSLFEVGPPLSPGDALQTWLDGQAATTLLRLPVELQISAVGVRGAAIGFAADRLAIKVNDSALGESLADRVAQYCGDEAETCALWLIGRWADGRFAVVRVDGAVGADERASATHALVGR